MSICVVLLISQSLVSFFLLNIFFFYNTKPKHTAFPRNLLILIPLSYLIVIKKIHTKYFPLNEENNYLNVL